LVSLGGGVPGDFFFSFILHIFVIMTVNEVDYSAVVEILEDILGDYKSHSDYKGQISFDCPTCSHDIKGLEHGDGKGNLEVNYKYGVYKCWVCAETHETHGSIYKLIKKWGNKKQLKNYLLLKPEDDEDNKRVYKPVKLPKEFVAFKDASNGLKMTPQYRQAFQYIKKRNITDMMLQMYSIGFCYSGEYENRIIIPSYDLNHNINYFVARSYLYNPRMKYKNPEAQKEILIFNEYLVNWDEPIYLVEGAFDSIFIPNSIPMLGKFMSEYLFSVLYEKAKKIVIVLDPDACADAEKLYHKLNCGKLMGKVWIVKLEGDKDIADLQGDLTDYKLKQLD
jgi:DNA primase